MEGTFRPSDLNDPALRLIETLCWDGKRLRRLGRHLERARTSSAALGFHHDAEAVRRVLSHVGGTDPLRVRLTLGRGGDTRVETAPLPPAPTEWRIALSRHGLDSGDPWLAHKTTRRALYDQTRAELPRGIDEVLFVNERGEICEGTITNVFFDLGDGLCTPALRCGLLPGILRGELIERQLCREAVLLKQDLQRAQIWVGNSLRGLIPARLTLETLPCLSHKQF